MPTLRTIFFFWYAVSLVPAYLLVRQFQDAGTFDSVGIWYTIYCAAGLAIPIALVLTASTKRLMLGQSWWWLRR